MRDDRSAHRARSTRGTLVLTSLVLAGWLATGAAAGAPGPPTGERAALWQQLRDGFGALPAQAPGQDAIEAGFRRHPEGILRVLQKGTAHLGEVLASVQRRGLPAELALLPAVESGFDPQALSPASALGLWQLMPATAEALGLAAGPWLDERRDPQASTRGALSLLARLHERFDDWPRALAAYNCGEGRVQREIDRNAARGLPTDFAHLDLPAETRDYVPRVLAVVHVVALPQDFGIVLPEPDGETPWPSAWALATGRAGHAPVLAPGWPAVGWHAPPAARVSLSLARRARLGIALVLPGR